MKTKALSIVRRLFNSELAPPHINRANRRKWVRSVRRLGKRWVLAEDQPLTLAPPAPSFLNQPRNQ